MEIFVTYGQIVEAHFILLGKRGDFWEEASQVGQSGGMIRREETRTKAQGFRPAVDFEASKINKLNNLISYWYMQEFVLIRNN